MKGRQSRDEGRATEERRKTALKEGTVKPDGDKKTRRKRVAERTSRRPRGCNVNPPSHASGEAWHSQVRSSNQQKGARGFGRTRGERNTNQEGVGGQEEKGLKSKGEWAIGKRREKGIKIKN
ncbi:hypothetical protein NDU88_006542 [Pleurodeles waltl]|uniref:Uncharacterized protein n=1 Tax=Pleurodeles waltl TaxID=8319 RepID=A0AAV7PNS2_PLEWA|nr:hypothetical protein NDU88_006542 [Pleurodeles waltl]